MSSGPLPPPEILKGYAEVYPDASEKTFKWVEEQQSHRHHMEEKQMDMFLKQNTIGVISGVIIALAFVVGGIILIIMDKEVIGLSIMAPVIISIVDNTTKKRSHRRRPGR